MLWKSSRAAREQFDVRFKTQKTFWGGTKMVRTTKAEQRTMRESILQRYPNAEIIDDDWEEENGLDWIDRLEELDALIDDA